MPKLFFYFLITLFFLISGCTDNHDSDSKSRDSKRRDTLRLGVTSTLEDSGLLAILTSRFSQEYGITIRPIVAGSGQLFRLIERGDVDIAISHEPEGEKILLANHIITGRQAVFYNYFVIVGSKEDPANIRQANTLEEVFQRLASSNSIFVSRNDNSGTHKAEQRLWQTVKSEKNITQLNTGTGMGATLLVAADRNAYTLVDIGTWLNFQNKQQLRILWDNPQALCNPYHLLIINTGMIKHTNNKPAQLFAEWINHTQTRRLISEYRLEQQAVFFTEGLLCPTLPHR